MLGLRHRFSKLAGAGMARLDGKTDSAIREQTCREIRLFGAMSWGSKIVNGVCRVCMLSSRVVLSYTAVDMRQGKLRMRRLSKVRSASGLRGVSN
jgi:hypothetical protein